MAPERESGTRESPAGATAATRPRTPRLDQPRPPRHRFLPEWDPEAFGGREHFLGAVGGLADFVRGTARAPGVEEITLPGDPERRSRERRAIEGIPVPDGTWALLGRTAQELAVAVPA